MGFWGLKVIGLWLWLGVWLGLGLGCCCLSNVLLFSIGPELA